MTNNLFSNSTWKLENYLWWFHESNFKQKTKSPQSNVIGHQFNTSSFLFVYTTVLHCLPKSFSLRVGTYFIKWKWLTNYSDKPISEFSIWLESLFNNRIKPIGWSLIKGKRVTQSHYLEQHCGKVETVGFKNMSF